MSKDRFEIWIDQARATSPSGGRAAVSVFLSFALSFLFQVFFAVFFAALFSSRTSFGSGALMLLSFLGFWSAIAMVRLWLHGLSLATVFGWSRRFEWRPFWGGLLCAFVGRIVSLLPIWTYVLVSGQAEAMAAQETQLTPQEGFLWKALLLLPLVLLQSGAEEALFRGHMTQILAARWRPLIWVWAGIPTLVFAAIHVASVPGAASGLVWTQVLFAGGLGLLCVVMTRVEGGLSGAIGFHTGNNYFVFLGLLLEGTSLTPDSALEMSPLPPLAMAVTLALYLGACVWVFTTRRLPFGRWIGLRP